MLRRCNQRATMSILAILLSLVTDPCRTYTVYSDPDREVCPVEQNQGPTWTWPDEDEWRKTFVWGGRQPG